MVWRNRIQGRNLIFSDTFFCRFRPFLLLRSLSGRIEVTVISVVGEAPVGRLRLHGALALETWLLTLVVLLGNRRR